MAKEPELDLERVRQMARQFPENGMKMLLENPANAADLLQLCPSSKLPLLNHARLKRHPTSFVQRDYRHIEADLVFTAPLLNSRSRRLVVYILIEHQSSPQRWMILRLLDYVLQIYKWQQREWLTGHSSLARFRPNLVLPVVFYTGKQPWRRITPLSELTEQGLEFPQHVPSLEPIPINLRDTPAETLESQCGSFGWLLRVVQQRFARLETFQQQLQTSVSLLEKTTRRQRARWLEMLSYLQALVYHERENPEHDNLYQMLEKSVRTDQQRKELIKMKRSMADVLKDEGREEGIKEGIKKGIKEGSVEKEKEVLESLKSTLREMLQKKFSKIPLKIEQRIQNVKKTDLLQQWMIKLTETEDIEQLSF